MLGEILRREPSPRATILHLIVGAALPLACLYLDPVVFKTGGLMAGPERAYFGAWRAFGYTAAAIAVIVLTRACATRVTAIETGLLYGAAVVAFTLGVALVPVSLFGLRFGIGILGFTPFAASWVYLRHAARQRESRAVPVIAGTLLFLAIPALVQLGVNQGVERAIVAGKPVSPVLRPLYDAEVLLDRYQDSNSVAEQRRLSIVYRSLTGRWAEEQLAMSND